MSKLRDPRKLVRTRASRYETWPELQRAVLIWCRERIAEENPGFDVAALEAQLRDWVSDWAADNDEAYNLLSGFLDAFAKVDKYLEAHPSAPEKSVFAAMMAGALASRCEGSDGDFSLSIRERFRCWRLVPDDVRWPLGSSPRARLVSMFEAAPHNVLWWRSRTPKVRDLAIIALLAGQWPGAAKKQQAEGSGAARPTVKDVVGAEENAIRALLSGRTPKEARTGT
jgi:hypothetical protein